MSLARWALVGALAAALAVAATIAVLVIQAVDEHERIVSSQLDER